MIVQLFLCNHVYNFSVLPPESEIAETTSAKAEHIQSKTSRLSIGHTNIFITNIIQ